VGKDGGLVLAQPRESLLKTAWPALEARVEERFEDWRAARIAQEQARMEEATIETIAAQAEDNLIVMPSPKESLQAKPTKLRCLPADYKTKYSKNADSAPHTEILGLGGPYERHEGGLLSRALGLAVHALFQHLAQQMVTQPLQASRASLTRLTPRIAADIRAIGVDPRQASRIAAQALDITLKASDDPVAQWILAPHAEAANEVRWTGIIDGSVRTVQMDRVFRAGPAPNAARQPDDQGTLWIVDYKTAHRDDLDPAKALPELRSIFAPQIEAYALVLRNLHGEDSPICGGLFYPRMSLFDWWEL
jgi:hypothetical protein